MAAFRAVSDRPHGRLRVREVLRTLDTRQLLWHSGSLARRSHHRCYCSVAARSPTRPPAGSNRQVRLVPPIFVVCLRNDRGPHSSERPTPRTTFDRTRRRIYGGSTLATANKNPS